MNVKFLVKLLAQEDISEAYSHFAEISEELGKQFLARIEQCFVRIRSHQEMYAVVMDGIRKVSLRQFPYVVDYLYENDTVFVLGVEYGARNPENWIARLKQ
jgi:plasmid stabilization system protein ParE